MKILEFGNKAKPKLLLIHGFQSPWQVWDEYIKHYQNDFHIIVPVLTGHNIDRKEDFVSFDDEEEAIEDFVIDHCNNIHAAFAMSMGGVLAAKLWQNQVITIEKVIFDGSPLVSVNGFVKNYMQKFYLKVTHKTQQHDQRTIRQASGSIISEEHLSDFIRVLENMTDRTVINCINEIAGYKLETCIDTPETSLYFFHGTGPSEMLAKKTAKYLKKHYPTTTVTCFDGKAHCENSLIHPDVMIAELDKIIL